MTICDHCNRIMLCDHCGTVEKAVYTWPQIVHDTCECLCHDWKSTVGKQRFIEMKKEARKAAARNRKKKK